MFRPMLAANIDDLNSIDWSRNWLVSAKLDGVRAVVRNGVVFSRSNKPIPNAYVQHQLGHLEHYDGELIVGEPTSKSCYRDTVSHVMSHDKTDFDLRFFVFDHIQSLHEPYQKRVHKVPLVGPKGRFVQHLQYVVTCLPTLLALEEDLLGDGYEGLILRCGQAPYKRGRSTVKEGYLMKLKRFVDAEATVIGFEERMHNGNIAETNELGRTKRSTHQANKSGRGDLGAILVRFGEVEFSIGTGLDDSERKCIWDNQDRYRGRIAKFKYFPIGVKEAPRHPVFLGWREEIDT